jgi:hypothetical protein
MYKGGVEYSSSKDLVNPWTRCRIPASQRVLVPLLSPRGYEHTAARPSGVQIGRFEVCGLMAQVWE